MSGRKRFEPDQALDAAVRVFWRLGYTGAGISDLLLATGLSRASLYATFGDKQHLFLSCLDRYVETVGTASRQALRCADLSVVDAVLAGFDAIIDRMADPAQPAGCLLAQTAAESTSLPQPVQAAVTRLLDDQIAQMLDLLAPSRWPRASDEDMHTLASYIVTFAQAVAVMHRAGTPVDCLRATSRLAVKALEASPAVLPAPLEVPSAGIGPATPRLGGGCSIH